MSTGLFLVSDRAALGYYLKCSPWAEHTGHQITSSYAATILNSVAFATGRTMLRSCLRSTMP